MNQGLGSRILESMPAPAFSLIFPAVILLSCSGPLLWLDTQVLPFRDSWQASPDQPWPGKEWYANRIQDWEIKDGRLRCLTGQQGPAGRTVHLLTREVGLGTKPVNLSVTIGATDLGPLQDGSCFGFLFGMGGNNIDYRATALVQQAPAPGGGILATLDSDGHLTLRDFSQSLQEKGYWTIQGNIDFRELPLLAESKQTFPIGLEPIRMHLSWKDGDLTLKALAQTNEKDLIQTQLEVPDFAREKLAGGISLFSARGSKNANTGFSFGSFQLEGAIAYPNRTWGPILGSLYTIARNRNGTRTLRMTIQHPILHREDVPQTELFLDGQDSFLGVYQMDGSFTSRFEIPLQNHNQATPFEVHLNGEPVYEGIIRAEPKEGQPASLALLSCLKNQVGPLSWNPSGLWFPHNDISRGIRAQDPDLLFFAGDQIYEGDITGVDRRSEWHSILDYHTKWQRFLWSFGDLTRVRPTICIPDDHDVFHGNLWGAGGELAKARNGITAQDAGGYKMPAKFVNAVHSTQVSHLPPSQVSSFIGQGISTYTTSFVWGGIDFCVLADRMWKDSPTVGAPQLKFKNGWPQAEDYQPKDADSPGLQLLGVEQEHFLESWAAERLPDTWTKVVLSQSPFACLHTLPGVQKGDQVVGRLPAPKPGEYPANDIPVMDADSNGWPQAARNRAVKSLSRAGALHLTGDQHLGTIAWYGKDDFRDGTIVFTGPAMGNTWPRRWMPMERGKNQSTGAPRYTGDYFDGFGNRVTVLAAANPQDDGRLPRLLHNRSPGYGVVRFMPSTQRITLEAWPRWSDGISPGQMFPGWPLQINASGRPISF